MMGDLNSRKIEQKKVAVVNVGLNERNSTSESSSVINPIVNTL